MSTIIPTYDGEKKGAWLRHGQGKYTLADGPRWLPPRSIQAIADAGLRRFALKNFFSPPRDRFARGCGARGRRGRHGAETFRAVEGSAPEGEL